MKKLIILSLLITGCSCLDLKKNPPPEQEFCIASPITEDFVCVKVFSEEMRSIPHTKVIEALIEGEYMATPRKSAEELFVYFKNLCDKSPDLCEKSIKKKIESNLHHIQRGK